MYPNNSFPSTSIPLFPAVTHEVVCVRDWHRIRSTETMGVFKINGEPPTNTASNSMMPIKIPARLGQKERHIVVQGPAGKKIKKTFTDTFRAMWSGRQTHDGCLMLWVTFAFPHKKTTPKKWLDKVVPYEKTPDGDNLLKNIADALEKAGVIRNDFLFTTEVITRVRAPQQYTGIWINVTNLVIHQ